MPAPLFGTYGAMQKALPGLLVTGEDFIDSLICATAAGIGFGAPVFVAEGEENDAYNAKADVLSFVLSAAFVTGNTIAGTVNGSAYSVPFATDDATTFAKLVDALDALPGTNSAGNFATRTITITTTGSAASASGTVSGGASQATVTVTAQALVHLLGVTIRTAKEYAQYSDTMGTVNNGGAAYNLGDAVGAVRIGKVWVSVGPAVLAHQPAYWDATNKVWTNVASGNLQTPYYFRTSAAAGELALLDVTKSPAALVG